MGYLATLPGDLRAHNSGEAKAQRRLEHLIEVFKLQEGKILIPLFFISWMILVTTHGDSRSIDRNQTFEGSSLPAELSQWNSLSSHIGEANSVLTFKKHLDASTKLLSFQAQQPQVSNFSIVSRHYMGVKGPWPRSNSLAKFKQVLIKHFTSRVQYGDLSSLNM